MLAAMSVTQAARLAPSGTWIDLPTHGDGRGDLTVAEEAAGLPFRPARTYWLHGLGAHSRGAHAHRRLRQCMVVVAGALTLELEDVHGLREMRLDIAEGADFVMVKPALHYLDIISDLKAESHLPVAAYHVSGECAMLLGAIERGWLDADAISETIISLGRAGADVIITYVARQYAKAYAQDTDLD